MFGCVSVSRQPLQDDVTATHQKQPAQALRQFFRSHPNTRKWILYLCSTMAGISEFRMVHRLKKYPTFGRRLESRIVEMTKFLEVSQGRAFIEQNWFIRNTSYMYYTHGLVSTSKNVVQFRVYKPDVLLTEFLWIRQPDDNQGTFYDTRMISIRRIKSSEKKSKVHSQSQHSNLC